jgi:MFS family permease
MGINSTVIALSTARLGDAVGNSILFVIIPLYVARLPSPFVGLPDSLRAGLLIALFGFAAAAFQPLAGILSDRMSRQKVFIQAGLAVMGVSTVGFVVAGNFIELLALRIAQGFGLALSLPASMAILTNATEERTRGASMGVYTTMRMLGLGVGPLMGGFFYDRWGPGRWFLRGLCVPRPSHPGRSCLGQ